MSSHPIHVEVNHPGEISQIFDEISYSKGGSILRMIVSKRIRSMEAFK